MNHLHSRSLAILAIAFTASTAHAQHGGDIYVGLDGNQLITGQINKEKVIDLTIRVHEAEFGDSGFEGFTTEPGFDGEAGTFNPAHRIGFNILSPLQVWNGTEYVATGGETLNISFLTAERNTAECFVAGFDLPVQADGGWHRHLSFFLSPEPVSGDRDPGIYLVKLELYSTAPGAIDSAPFWIAFNHLETEALHESATGWAATHLAGCPADLDRNGLVNVSDLLGVIGGWGSGGPPCGSSDLNHDQVTNVVDLLAVISAWGACP